MPEAQQIDTLEGLMVLAEQLSFRHNIRDRSASSLVAYVRPGSVIEIVTKEKVRINLTFDEFRSLIGWGVARSPDLLRIFRVLPPMIDVMGSSSEAG